MDWTLPTDGSRSVPKYRRIADLVRTAVADGRLRPGERIPSIADLAGSLGVNKTTVVRAFRELEAEQAIVSRVGKGSFVAADEAAPAVRSAAPDAAVARSIRRLRSSYVAGIAQLLEIPAPPGAIDLRSGVPPAETVEPEALSALVDRALADDPRRLYGYAHAGLPEFRRAVADRLAGDGVTVSPDQVLATNGSQEGLALVAGLALDEERSMLSETPTYIGIPLVFTQQRHVVTSVPIDPPGTTADRFARLAAGRRTLLYTCPDFQNPTGRTMSGAERDAVAEVAGKSDTLVVVDELFRDLRFRGEAPRNLYASLPAGRRVLVGSISKSFLPGLRAGWLVADGPVFDALLERKKYLNLGSATLTQAIAAAFLREGYADHLGKVREFYRERADATIAAMEEHFPEEAEFTRPEGGFQLWVRLPSGFSAVSLYLRALERGVLVSPGPAHDLDGGFPSCFRIGYGHTRPAEITRAVSVLGEVIREILDAGPGAPNATGLGLHI